MLNLRFKSSLLLVLILLISFSIGNNKIINNGNSQLNSSDVKFTLLKSNNKYSINNITNKFFSYKEVYNVYATGDLTIVGDISEDVEILSNLYDYYNVLYKGKCVPLSSSSTNIPKSIDNSQSKYFPEVGNQGKLNTCTCWSEVYYQFTYEFNRKNGIETTPQTTYSPLFVYKFLNKGRDNGVFEEDVYEFLKKYGCTTICDVPYNEDYLSWTLNEQTWTNALNSKLEDYQGFEDIGTNDLNLITTPNDKDLSAIKIALANGDIISYTTYIESCTATHIKDIPNSTTNKNYVGEEAIVSCDGTDGKHRMTIVGYDDDVWIDINSNNIVDNGEMGAFKAVNSWGSEYANNGFIWIAYDAINYKSCVVGTDNARERQNFFYNLSRIDVGAYGDTSGIFLKLKLNSADRYHSGVEVILQNLNTDTEISCELFELFNGGSCIAYDGTTDACDMDFVFDLNYLIKQTDSCTLNDYSIQLNFHDDIRNYKPLTVKNIEIYDSNKNISYTNDELYPFSIDKKKTLVDITGLIPKYYEPLNFKYNSNNKATTDLYSTYTTGNISVTGGCMPYNYKLEIVNEDNSVIYTSGYTDNKSLYSEFKTEGTFTINVYVKDYVGTEIMKSEKTTVTDMPFRIESFDITSDKNINVGDTVSFSASTINDNCSVQNTMFVSVVKDSIIYYKENISVSSYDIYSKCANYNFCWKPNSSGEYYITVTRVDNDNQHYSKTISIWVNNVDAKLSVTLNKEKNLCVGDDITITATSLYDNGAYQYMYSCERYGQEVTISEYSNKSNISINIFEQAGPYKIIVRAKNINDVVCVAQKDIWVNQPYIKSIVADKSILEAGQSINITAQTQNISSNISSDECIFTVINELSGNCERFTAQENSFEWTPKEKSNYTIQYNIYIDNQIITSLSNSFEVT